MSCPPLISFPFVSPLVALVGICVRSALDLRMPVTHQRKTRQIRVTAYSYQAMAAMQQAQHLLVWYQGVAVSKKFNGPAWHAPTAPYRYDLASSLDRLAPDWHCLYLLSFDSTQSSGMPIRLGTDWTVSPALPSSGNRLMASGLCAPDGSCGRRAPFSTCKQCDARSRPGMR